MSRILELRPEYTPSEPVEEIIDRIFTMTENELRRVMEAIQERYAMDYPEWDVVYIALHTDPELRKQEYADILKYIEKDIEWHQTKE